MTRDKLAHVHNPYGNHTMRIFDLTSKAMSTSELFYKALTQQISSTYSIINAGAQIPPATLLRAIPLLNGTIAMNAITYAATSAALSTIASTYPQASTTAITQHVENYANNDEYITHTDYFSSGITSTVDNGKIYLKFGGNAESDSELGMFVRNDGGDNPGGPTSDVVETPITTGGTWESTTAKSSNYSTALCTIATRKSLVDGSISQVCGWSGYGVSREVTLLKNYPCATWVCNRWLATSNFGASKPFFKKIVIPSTIENPEVKLERIAVSSSLSLAALTVSGVSSRSRRKVVSSTLFVPSHASTTIGDFQVIDGTVYVSCVVSTEAFGAMEDPVFNGVSYTHKCEISTLSVVMTEHDTPYPEVEVATMLRSCLSAPLSKHLRYTPSATSGSVLGYSPLHLSPNTVGGAYVTYTYGLQTQTIIPENAIINSNHTQLNSVRLYMPTTGTRYYGNASPANTLTWTTSTIDNSTSPLTMASLNTAFKETLLVENLAATIKMVDDSLACSIEAKSGAASNDNIKTLHFKSILISSYTKLMQSMLRMDTAVVWIDDVQRSNIYRTNAATSSANRDLASYTLAHTSTPLLADSLFLLPALILTNRSAARTYLGKRWAYLLNRYRNSHLYGNALALSTKANSSFDSSLIGTKYTPSVIIEFAALGFNAWNHFRTTTDTEWLTTEGYAIINGCARVCYAAFSKKYSTTYGTYYMTLENVKGFNDTSGKTANMTASYLSWCCIRSALEACYETQRATDERFERFMDTKIQLPLGTISGNTVLFNDYESLQTCKTAGLTSGNYPTSYNCDALICLHPCYISHLFGTLINVYIDETSPPMVLNTDTGVTFTNDNYNYNVTLMQTKFTNQSAQNLLLMANCIAFTNTIQGTSTAATNVDISETLVITALNKFSDPFSGWVGMSYDESMTLSALYILYWVCGILGFRFKGKISPTYTMIEAYGFNNVGTTSISMPAYLNSATVRVLNDNATYFNVR